VKILHLFAEGPGPLAQKLMEAQSLEHEVIAVDLSPDDVSYDTLVDEIFAADRVISWNSRD
jgi:hypothetical protein